MLKTSTKQVVSTTFSCHDIKILTWRQQVKRITHVDNKWNANFGPANCKMLWRWLLFYFSFFTSKESLLKQSKGTWNSNPQFLIQKCLIHWVSQWVSPHERSKPPPPPCRIFNPLRQLASNPCAFRPPPSHWLSADCRRIQPLVTDAPGITKTMVWQPWALLGLQKQWFGSFGRSWTYKNNGLAALGAPGLTKTMVWELWALLGLQKQWFGSPRGVKRYYSNARRIRSLLLSNSLWQPQWIY